MLKFKVEILIYKILINQTWLRGDMDQHAFHHPILVTQRSPKLPTRTQRPIPEVYRGDSSQHFNRQSSLQEQSGLQTLTQEGNRGVMDQHAFRQSMQSDDPQIIIQQQNLMMHQLLAEKNELLAFKMAAWEKEREAEKKRMLEEQKKLEVKQKYWAMKAKRHQMINGAQNQIERMNFARANNPSYGFLRLGDDPKILQYLANNKEQENFPYYWVDKENYIRCHCFGNPIAKWEEERNWYKCLKTTKAEGKCSFFLPVGQLYQHL